MTRNKFNTVIAIICGCVAASSLNASTIPAGTTLNVSTASSISSQDPVGRTFAAQIDREVAVKGTVVLNTSVTLTVTPGTKMQFQLVQAANL
jgi:ABC-type molybdate transport system substrate-binding protein